MKDFASYGGEGDGEEFLSRYAGKDEGALTKEIYARAVEGKRAGTLTNEQIDAFYARFAPMLDAAKRKKLQKLIEQLKRM